MAKVKPDRAMKHLLLICDTQKSVSTQRIRDLVQSVYAKNKMLEADNRRLRKKIKRMQKKGS